MKVIISIVVILILFFFVIKFLEQKVLYYPLQKIEGTPRDIGLDYEEIFVTTADGVRISAWFVPSVSPRATLLFSHGNGGNIGHRLDKIKILQGLDVNVLVYDYRGYGMSKGSPSEDGLYLDAEAVYGYLVNDKKISPGKIIAYGESLGGAVTVDLASKHPVGGIIIEGSFTSIRDMANKFFPFIPAFFFKSSFNSFEKIKDITFPKLYFHSTHDEVVPFKLGRRLFENSPGPKEFVELQGGHNDSFLVSEDVFTAKTDSFIGSCVGR